MLLGIPPEIPEGIQQKILKEISKGITAALFVEISVLIAQEKSQDAKMSGIFREFNFNVSILEILCKLLLNLLAKLLKIRNSMQILLESIRQICENSWRSS